MNSDRVFSQGPGRDRLWGRKYACQNNKVIVVSNNVAAYGFEHSILEINRKALQPQILCFKFYLIGGGHEGAGSINQKNVGALTSSPFTNVQSVGTENETNHHFNVDSFRNVGHHQTCSFWAFDLERMLCPFFFLLALCSTLLKILFIS